LRTATIPKPHSCKRITPVGHGPLQFALKWKPAPLTRGIETSDCAAWSGEILPAVLPALIIRMPANPRSTMLRGRYSIPDDTVRAVCDGTRSRCCVAAPSNRSTARQARRNKATNAELRNVHARRVDSTTTALVLWSRLLGGIRQFNYMRQTGARFMFSAKARFQRQGQFVRDGGAYPHRCKEQKEKHHAERQGINT